MTKNYALFLLNQLCVGASVDAKPIIPQFELAQALSVAIKALEQQPCEDCISRAEVLKILEKEEFKGDAIYEIEKKLPSVTPKAERWIPCTERLPKDGDTYLVTIEYKGEVIGVDAASYSPVEGYINKHWDTFNDWKEDEDLCYHVTAWMPLPEPYMAESEVEDER